ncbi:MAG: nuclear transport factor 2 family protein [Acidimicrobiales bacterium]
MNLPTDHAPTDQGALEANVRFYEALEQGDLAAMIALWAHDDDVACAHPGRRPLQGWDGVRASWEAIFGNGGNPQVIVTDEHLVRRGPVAWITLTENLLSGGQAGAATALNLFVHTDDGWRMVGHHAAPVLL